MYCDKCGMKLKDDENGRCDKCINHEKAEEAERKIRQRNIKMLIELAGRK